MLDILQDALKRIAELEQKVASLFDPDDAPPVTTPAAPEAAPTPPADNA